MSLTFARFWSERNRSLLMEDYESANGFIARKVLLRDGSVHSSELDFDSVAQLENPSISSLYDLIWLNSKKKPDGPTPRGELRIADFFSGCGGLSLGIQEAARAVGLKPVFRAALDFDEPSLDVYANNFPGVKTIKDPIETVFDGEVGSKPTESEERFLNDVGTLDLVIGGPPCQGHSALNNHTRHNDDRNQLYLKMARVCEIVKPQHLIIENVPGVLKDKSMVAQKTWEVLRNLGYTVDSKTIDAAEVGVAQHRKRNFTVASKSQAVDLALMFEPFKTDVRSISWALQGLQNFERVGSFDTPANSSQVNDRRMRYLIENNLYELPDHMRPDCHRLKAHSYKSVYGRLRWSEPSQTITTGFGGMGRGRYVHPEEARTITPHEAARIQFFPDFFQFSGQPRTTLQSLIGNAVPPKLGYVIGVGLLR
jgi:DNA (cytosine-5)-methyltransferase 1